MGSVNGLNPTQSGTGFLSFNSLPPRLWITSEDEEFDETTIQHWKDEGFDVTYLPMNGGGKPYVQELKRLADDLELGEAYALVAYGDAATICLDVATKPMPHCCALICYYPTSIPHPTAKYPSSLNLTIHLTHSQGFVPSFPVYLYSGVEPGFAEHDLDEFNRVSASLAWSRSLAAVRRGFKKDISEHLERTNETFKTLSLKHRDAAGTVGMMVQDSPYVNHVPTMTGGIGKRALYHFYHDFFIPGNPPSLRVQLVSRTVGVNRVVDEFVVSFKHTVEMPWILPGVPPTNKTVSIAIVSIVTVRGGKLEHEHVYWDQASVLQQIGALSADNVPQALKSKGCKKLPIVGVEGTKKVLDVDKLPSNELIPKW
ncbi:hypothetical protein, variant [Verruconis gallopava]|uniref:SnoaL-like domain-containing protein n=1 Tax=Verruconis gallopava TaxID=253628 RepID=A0A0D1YXY8_9PEZI|nr:hypothetical protein, variant [Verruconis gallopava]KIW05527.1 hypothetical protein, variant [Verruconis gallopava]